MTDHADTAPAPGGGRRSRGRPRTRGGYRCDRCGRSAGKLRTSWPEGGICGTCFHDAVRTFGTCGHCGREDRMLPGRARGRQLCRACAGIDTDLDCHRCGVEAEHYRRGICARCALRDDLTTVLAPRQSDVLPSARKLIDVLCAAERPESIHTWKRRPEVQTLLRGIGDGTVPVSHEALDQAGDRKVADHLREVLVHHEILAPRDHDLALFDRWLRNRLDSTDPPWARRVLEQYATWHHVRAIRARLARDQPVRGSVHNAKQEITEVGRLLAWLHQHDTTLKTCRQSQLDQWLVDGPSTRYIVRTFIRWASRQRLAPKDLEIARRTTQSTPTITEQTRLDWIARCLRDEPETRAYRTAAVLLLLYAQPLVRIAALRCDQILATPDGPAILLGDEPAALPHPFSGLLIEHLDHRPNMQTTNTDNTWVFPGARAGQHIRPNTVMVRLRTLGIDLRGARNTALKELVQRVPPPIVASQLGYSPAITQRHAELASAPRSRYGALISSLGQTSGRR